MKGSSVSTFYLQFSVTFSFVLLGFLIIQTDSHTDFYKMTTILLFKQIYLLKLRKERVKQEKFRD